MEQLSVPQGQFQLARYPIRKDEKLRAWDAADEYLLQQLAEEQAPARLLIINDNFGALSVALADFQPEMMSDSYLAHAGTQANLKNNGINIEQVQLHSSISPLSGHYNLVIIKVTKSLALLEDQLHRLRPHLSNKTKLLGAGMVKNIHNSTLKLFERIIGPTTTSLARKKARLIFCQLDSSLKPKPNPFPKRYSLEGSQHSLFNHAGVFSRDSLDIGTRFMLQNLPSTEGALNVIDLGCGNGALGIMLAEQNPAAALTFVDESFMAIASAKAGFRTAFGERQAQFKTTDCLAGIDRNSADLIINNPPFHQQNVVGDHIARQMFRESKQVLRKGGELWVIGNRHLGYQTPLKRIFGNCEQVASNNKFVILRSCKQ